MSAPTFADFVAGPWKRDCFERCRPSTRQRVESALRTQLLPQFGDARLDQIGPGSVHRWFDRYSRTAPAGANRTLDVLRQILNHAIVCGHLGRNPTQGVIRNPYRKPTRFLSLAEVRRLHEALNAHRARGSGSQQADLLRLLLLTGCRRGELVALRWSEIDGDVLHLTDSKTGPRPVFLSREARAILNRQPRTGSEFVFPAPGDPSRPRSGELSLWRKVRREAGLGEVRLHDLRHTFASHAVMLGVPLPVVSRLLGHAQTRMTLRYAHVGDRETEAAAERIGTAIAAVLAEPPDVANGTRAASGYGFPYEGDTEHSRPGDAEVEGRSSSPGNHDVVARRGRASAVARRARTRSTVGPPPTTAVLETGQAPRGHRRP